MPLWTTLTAQAADFLKTGPLGALFDSSGVAAMPDVAAGRRDINAIGFTIGVIALSAKMAKADGIVDDREIQAFRDIFEINPSDMTQVTRVFNLAQQSVHGFEAYAKQLAKLLKGEREVLENVLDGLFHIATADHFVDPKEIEFLESVAKIFGFSDACFCQIKARNLGTDPNECAKDPYMLLNLSADASDQEIKTTYRKLVSENHPDKLIARGVPEEFITLATAKLTALNNAYDQIKAQRNLM